ncbi:class I SAM-dependent methyltransferase [Kribbella sp. CA-247076]|uniref:class I SAM-dependent methyltransferase n=1 Tax=Kribbella sp. CA-247076 TaxID=3239941 RepID=UPI003D94AEC5
MRSGNERNRAIYQRLASIYDVAARLPLIARPRSRLFSLADIQPGDRVLLIGVGTGQDLPYLPAGADVTGIDLSPAMLDRARARGTGATLQEMDAEHLEFPDASFDVVILSYVLSVVNDPRRALAEAARVLTPDGSIWILGKFHDAEPGPGRRLASRVLTTVGGATLTRSLTATIADTPLRITRHETANPLADITQLTPHEKPS